MHKKAALLPRYKQYYGSSIQKVNPKSNKGNKSHLMRSGLINNVLQTHRLQTPMQFLSSKH